MPTRKLSSRWCPKQWRKCVFTASSQWSKILAGIEWYFHRGLLYLGRSWYWELYSLGQKPTKQFSRWRLCTYTWCWIQIRMEWRKMQWLSSVYLQERYSFSTGRPPSASGGRFWLKSEQRSFVIYRKTTVHMNNTVAIICSKMQNFEQIFQ